MITVGRFGVALVAIAMAGAASAAEVGNLYSNHRAMKVDDILTVLIVESAKAGSQSGTSTSKGNDIGIQAAGGSGALSFIPAFGASAGAKIGYDGKGSTSREGNLVAKISASVVRKLDNGNLAIEGSKMVEIDNEKEVIKISGIVRPADIEPNNVIYSYNIADAQITYTGKGACNTARRPGLITQVLNWIF